MAFHGVTGSVAAVAVLRAGDGIVRRITVSVFICPIRAMTPSAVLGAGHAVFGRRGIARAIAAAAIFWGVFQVFTGTGLAGIVWCASRVLAITTVFWTGLAVFVDVARPVAAGALVRIVDGVFWGCAYPIGVVIVLVSALSAIFWAYLAVFPRLADVILAQTSICVEWADEFAAWAGQEEHAHEQRHPRTDGPNPVRRDVVSFLSHVRTSNGLDGWPNDPKLFGRTKV